MRQHAMLVFELDAKHGVGQRLDNRGHHFDSVFLGVAVAIGLPFPLNSFRIGHALLFRPLYQQGPLASRGRVNTQGPWAVTATVCSKCAASLPSSVTAVHLSSSTRTFGPPEVTIGSMARTIPCCRRGAGPGA